MIELASAAISARMLTLLATSGHTHPVDKWVGIVQVVLISISNNKSTILTNY